MAMATAPRPPPCNNVCPSVTMFAIAGFPAIVSKRKTEPGRSQLGALINLTACTHTTHALRRNDEKNLVRVTEGWSPLNYPNLTLFLTITASPIAL